MSEGKAFFSLALITLLVITISLFPYDQEGAIRFFLISSLIFIATLLTLYPHEVYEKLKEWMGSGA